MMLQSIQLCTSVILKIIQRIMKTIVISEGISNKKICIIWTLELRRVVRIGSMEKFQCHRNYQVLNNAVQELLEGIKCEY